MASRDDLYQVGGVAREVEEEEVGEVGEVGEQREAGEGEELQPQQTGQARRLGELAQLVLFRYQRMGMKHVQWNSLINTPRKGMYSNRFKWLDTCIERCPHSSKVSLVRL